MMVETILESSQDFGMSNGALPQWKRELLQRRAARARPPVAPAPPAPPPPPLPADEDEELRYGPGIVKRLKSRYLSLALREAPRRRPSVLRRAASLEHLLDERPPPAPRPHSRPTRPVSLAAPSYSALSAPSPRRDSVKRARSVDALSRLDSRDETPPQIPLQPPPQPPPPPPSPPPPLPRSVRPPRRPTPLLRETERPPADVVRSTLRKFETAPPRRTAPAARVSAVLRGLENLPRSSTPEPRGRSPSPAAADLSAIDEPEGAAISATCDEAKPVSQAALEGIARAGSSIRYSFEAPNRGTHLPPLSATNPVMLGRSRLSASPRRVGVIRPMPAPTLDRSTSSPTPNLDDTDEKDDMQIIPSPLPYENDTTVKKDPPVSIVIEPIIRSGPDECDQISAQLNGNSIASVIREVTPEPEVKPQHQAQVETSKIPATKSLVNGHATPPKPETKPKGNAFSRIGAAGIERAWTGADEKKANFVAKEKKENVEPKNVAPWSRGNVASNGVAGSPGSGRKPRQPAPASTSVVFNFSNRKEVPDYIENDGIILRANRRNRFKAGEAGIVVLRPEALAASSDSEEEDTRPPSPCSVRFVNDNVLINGRSSMAARSAIRDRAARLKLQFDDSLTRTFEYPSETSLCEDSPTNAIASTNTFTNASANSPTPTETNTANTNGDTQQIAQPAHLQPLAANTHIASASLSRYTPHKTCADAFQLGLTRRHEPARAAALHDTERLHNEEQSDAQREAEEVEVDTEAEVEVGDARPCAAESARSWSEARTHATDLLF